MFEKLTTLVRHPVPIGRELGSRRKKMVVHFWGRSHVKLDSIKNWELGKGGSRKFRSDMHNGAKVFLKSYSLFLFESSESHSDFTGLPKFVYYQILRLFLIFLLQMIYFTPLFPSKYEKKITLLCS